VPPLKCTLIKLINTILSVLKTRYYLFHSSGPYKYKCKIAVNILSCPKRTLMRFSQLRSWLGRRSCCRRPYYAGGAGSPARPFQSWTGAPARSSCRLEGEFFNIFFYHDFAKIHSLSEILQNYTSTAVGYGVRYLPPGSSVCRCFIPATYQGEYPR
jgi:hypothetical protein